MIIPYRKPTTAANYPPGSKTPNVEHRPVRAGGEQALARMKCFKILRDYSRAGHTWADAVSGIANLHNIILTG
ncbi:hypothetical protein OG992_31625 [Micromonospora sp. NBC_00362]|uniref:hypothetical protein n=1 Tax=Micromonospora sp. NBC_00362 TaxID=2975975 RepID=UPI00225389C5|nr:hypothetical protein [Micromonospora sp. NBC_00362]MCX5121733.1 hypothetical protein [Micromonospora sp. NBC_00362]